MLSLIRIRTLARQRSKVRERVSREHCPSDLAKFLPRHIRSRSHEHDVLNRVMGFAAEGFFSAC